MSPYFFSSSATTTTTPTTMMTTRLSIASLLLLFSALTLSQQTPSTDPFYTPSDSNWRTTDPGTILAHRLVPQPLKNVTYQTAHQLLYRTTDSLGDPIPAVTTVIRPRGDVNTSRLLSYQIVYDTAEVDCSPSYVLQQGGLDAFDNGFTYGLNAGVMVNSPDYEGPKAAFTAGKIAGQATLDSIRAALASGNITGVEEDATVAMWGYSGGALATEWAAELQHTYAPELKISGSAMGGLTPNITSVAVTINDGPNAGLLASGILGLAAAYPNITTFLNDSFVSNEARDQFYKAKDECVVQTSLQLADKDVLGFFKDGAGILTDQRTAFAVADGGIMGTHGMPLPGNKLYFYKSTKDEVSPIADTDKLVDKYCAQGASVHYVRDDFGSHMEEAMNGGFGALEFLAGVLNGDSDQGEGCVIETKNQEGDNKQSSSIAATTTVMSAIATGAMASPTSGGGGEGSSTSDAPNAAFTDAADGRLGVPMMLGGVLGCVVVGLVGVL